MQCMLQVCSHKTRRGLPVPTNDKETGVKEFHVPHGIPRPGFGQSWLLHLIAEELIETIKIWAMLASVECQGQACQGGVLCMMVHLPGLFYHL